jgi:hypothetical protein
MSALAETRPVREQIEQLIKDAESIRFRMYDLHKLTGDVNTGLEESVVNSCCSVADLLVRSLERLLIDGTRMSLRVRWDCGRGHSHYWRWTGALCYALFGKALE